MIIPYMLGKLIKAMDRVNGNEARSFKWGYNILEDRLEEGNITKGS